MNASANLGPNVSVNVNILPQPTNLPVRLMEDADLALRICRRLGNRVRGLRVLRKGGGLVIQGRTSTYYAKQLAQHAAMELDSEPILANDIEVL